MEDVVLDPVKVHWLLSVIDSTAKRWVLFIGLTVLGYLGCYLVFRNKVDANESPNKHLSAAGMWIVIFVLSAGAFSFSDLLFSKKTPIDEEVLNRQTTTAPTADTSAVIE